MTRTVTVTTTTVAVSAEPSAAGVGRGIETVTEAPPRRHSRTRTESRVIREPGR